MSLPCSFNNISGRSFHIHTQRPSSLFITVVLQKNHACFIRSLQFSSVNQSCPTLCHPYGLQHARRSLPITNSQSLLRLMSIVSVMPSNHLILWHPLLLLLSIFPSIRVFSKESVLCIRWPKFKTLKFKSICAHISQKDLAYYTFLFWEIYLVTLTGL